MDVALQLKVSDLTAIVAEKTLLNGVTFGARGGELISVLGPNGAGKTTLLRLIAGLGLANSRRLDVSGNISISGHEPGRTGGERGVSYIPDLDPIPDCSIRVREFLRGTAPKRNNFRLHRKRYSVTWEGGLSYFVELLRLECLMERDIASLSGGERQRVLLASALMERPRVILLDEPSSFLDPKGAWEVWSIIKELCLQERCTALCVTHDINIALSASDRLLFLRAGALLGAISPDEDSLSNLLQATFATPFRVVKDTDGTRLATVAALGDNWRRAAGKGGDL